MEHKLPTTTLPISAANLVAIVTAAYTSAIAGLATLTGDQLKKARNRLFFGSRIGSKVEGVRDQLSVDQMLRRSIMANGLMLPVFQNLEGHNVYCFKLSCHYAGGGKTTYVRLRELLEKGELFLSNVSIGVDYCEDLDMERMRLQAPKVRNISSNIITVILSADNSVFVEWFCGEPKKTYNATNLHEILDQRGELDMTKVWIHLSLDYNLRTRDKKRRIADYEHRSEPKQHQLAKKHGYADRPLNDTLRTIAVSPVQSEAHAPEVKPVIALVPEVS